MIGNPFLIASHSWECKCCMSVDFHACMNQWVCTEQNTQTHLPCMVLALICHLCVFKLHYVYSGLLMVFFYLPDAHTHTGYCNCGYRFHALARMAWPLQKGVWLLCQHICVWLLSVRGQGVMCMSVARVPKLGTSYWLYTIWARVKPGSMPIQENYVQL